MKKFFSIELNLILTNLVLYYIIKVIEQAVLRSVRSRKDRARARHTPESTAVLSPSLYTASQDARIGDAEKRCYIMNFAEIEKLLDKGFTPEQIMQLQDAPASKDDAVQKQDPASASKDVQKQDVGDQKQDARIGDADWAKALTESISGLRKTIQAQALAAAQQSAPKSVDDMAQDALAAIIAPTYNKNEGGK